MVVVALESIKIELNRSNLAMKLCYGVLDVIYLRNSFEKIERNIERTGLKGRVERSTRKEVYSGNLPLIGNKKFGSNLVG